MSRRGWLPRTTILAVAACGQDATYPVQIVSVPFAAGHSCAAPANAVTLELTGWSPRGATTRSLRFDEPTAFAAVTGYPADVGQWRARVIGQDGATLRVGASAPSQAPSDTVALAMTPPDGACLAAVLPTGRAEALVVATQGGALILGGREASGPSSSAWFYDMDRGLLEPVVVPAVLGAGFTGASATALADGRIAILGGPATALTVFDPATRELSAPLLTEGNLAHAASAAGPGALFVAGGCAELDGCPTTSPARRRTRRVDLADGAVAPLANTMQARAGHLVVPDPQRPADGWLLLGGRDDTGASSAVVEWFDATAGVIAVASGAPSAGLRLPSGAVVAAFASEGDVAHAQVAWISWPRRAVTPLAAAPSPRAGATVVDASDGWGWAFGGGELAVTRFDAERARWADVGLAGDRPTAVRGASATRLADGSLLVVGGEDVNGDLQDGLWRVRGADVVSPWMAAVSITPSQERSLGALVASDLAQTSRDARGLVVRGDTDGVAVALVGPAVLDGEVAGAALATLATSVTVDWRAGTWGLVITPIAETPDLAAVSLSPGLGRGWRLDVAPTGTVRAIADDGSDVACDGQLPVPSLPATVRLTFDLGADRAEIRLGEARATCARPTGIAGGLGFWLAPAAELTIATVSVDRR